MTKEQFFLLALMQLGRYDFTGDPEIGATREESTYMEEFEELAKQHGFDDTPIVGTEGCLFAQYYQHWRDESSRLLCGSKSDEAY